MLRLMHTDLFKQQVSYLPYLEGKYHILILKSLAVRYKQVCHSPNPQQSAGIMQGALV